MILSAGQNSHGQLGIGSTVRSFPHTIIPFGSSEHQLINESQVHDIVCGSHSTIVLYRDGTIDMCGTLYGSVMPYLYSIDIPLPLKCVQVSCGRKHVIILMERGVILSWGVGYFGQLGHGDDSSWETPRIISALDPRRIGSQIKYVSCGGSHSAALSEAGQVFMWGLNRSGQCGQKKTSDSVLEPSPVDCSEIGNQKVSKVVCGRNHNGILTSQGRLYVWGDGSMFRLGLGDNRKHQSYPVEVQTFRNLPIKEIALGDFHMLALTSEKGTVYSWGCSIDGQTGHSTLMNVKTPKCIQALDHLQINSIACGSTWSVAVTVKGNMYVFGCGDGGWFGIPTPPSASLPYYDIDSGTQSLIASQISEDHVKSFDSNHIIPRPYLVFVSNVDGRVIIDEVNTRSHLKVDKVRCGSGHMIMFCKARTAEDTEDEIPNEKMRSMDNASEIRKMSNNKIDGVMTSDERIESHDMMNMNHDTAKSCDTFESESVPTKPILQSSSASSKFSNITPPHSSSQITTLPVHPDNNHANNPQNNQYDRNTQQQEETYELEDDDDDSEALGSQLMSWCRHNKITQLASALKNGACVNMKDSSGNSPLIVACQNGHLGICKLLLSHSADLNQCNNVGNTPLHYCFHYGYEDIGLYLIQQGADEFITNNNGLTCYEGFTQSDVEAI